MHLDDVAVGTALVRVAVLGVLEQDVVHVGAGVLEQLVAAAEHDQSDLTVAQHAQLVRLLHQAELALRERHLYGRIYTTVKTTRMTWPINTLLEPHIYHEQIILENSFPGNRLHCYGQPNPQ